MSQSTDNVTRYLEAAARRHPDRTALIEPKDEGATTWSFLELNARADWMAAGLRAEGIEPGDRVIAMVPMSLKLYQVLLGTLKIGAVAVFVDPWVGLREIAGFASYADPTGFVGVPKSHAVRVFEKSLRSLPFTMTTGPRIFSIPARRTWSEVPRVEGRISPHPNRSGDTALITFTGGSSGMPKGADRTHGFLSAQHEALNAEFPYREDAVDMPTFPVFSLNNLANGVPTVIPDIDFRNVADADGGRIVDQMQTHGVTTATASPPFFDRLCDAVERRDEGIELRRILTGGAPVSDEQLRRWKDVLGDTEIIVIYGSTEAEPVAHIDADARLDADDRRGFCVGTLVGAIDAKAIPIRREPVVLDDQSWSDLEVDTGEIGELVVTGDHVCERYFRNPEATAENKIVEDDGTVWHRMGDTGYFDDEGRFWLTGRVHSTVFRGGRPVQAQVVEQAAAGDDARIERVAAVGIDTGDRERLAVVVEPAFESLPGDVLGDVHRRLIDEGIEVDRVVFSDGAIPVDPRHNAKVDYSALRLRVGERLEWSGNEEGMEVE